MWDDSDAEEEPLELTGGPGAPDGGDEDSVNPPAPHGDARQPPEFRAQREIHYIDDAEGPYPMMLREALQIIGATQRPHFEAYRTEDPGQQGEWRVSAVITIQDPRFGTRREIHANNGQVMRRSLDAGVSEAAWRALARICYIYSDELADSKFRICPHGSRGAASAQIPHPPPEERNPTMDVAQEMVAALSNDLDAAGVELDEVKDELRRLHCQCQILEARQQGQQEPPPLDYDE